MNEFDKKIITGLKYLKLKLGVSYTKIGEVVGISRTAIYKYLMGMTNTIGYNKKKQLEEIIDQYKKVDLKGDK
ncbi:MAG: hypothetical protein ACERLG_00730 [Sedimentibacter sp.]